MRKEYIDKDLRDNLNGLTDMSVEEVYHLIESDMKRIYQRKDERCNIIMS